MRNPPVHHREIFRYLREQLAKPAEVFIYGDNQGKNRIPVAHFGSKAKRFYSTLGVCDSRLPLPTGKYEFAALGAADWLPNALTSSIYWLKGRRVKCWPMVCEDVVKDNTRSTYRHMAYLPSGLRLMTSEAGVIRWLLGVPIADSEITIDLDEAVAKVSALYPKWLTKEGDPQKYTGGLD